jgi:Fe-S-cluster containining protein
MRDGPIRAVVKALARGWYASMLAIHRARHKPAYELAGACQGCAKCCEEPSIYVGRLLFWLPLTRKAFIAWQRWVNGFVLVREERRARVLVFECSHFDQQTRRCDSYATRPGMCRDYPRMLLDGASPDFFDGCGYRPVAVGASDMIAALVDRGVEGEQLVELKRRLHLEDPPADDS